MKTHTTIMAALMVGLFFVTGLYAQSAGDFRSAADGNWSAAATWETYDGSAWAAAANAPTGTETITIDDSVAADAAVIISDTVIVTGENGRLAVAGGSVTVAANGVYQHDRNGGELPAATWDSASTCVITGVTSSSPGNANQNFYHFTWNCPNQSSNLNLAWSGNTIGGNLTCISSGGNRFQMSNNAAILAPITINGDVVVTGGALTATGSSGAATYEVITNGNVIVTGGNFSLSRGSGGIVNWTLNGDFSVSDATLQTSNSASKFIFSALDTQMVSLSNISYTGTYSYDVDSAATIQIVDNSDTVDFTVRGTFTNNGTVLKDSAAVISFENNSRYIHARAGGSIPMATWRDGSTIELTGITGQAPSNGNQNFYNVIWNSPGQSANLNLGWDDNVIGGDISVVNTGGNRWQLTAPPTNDTTITTIMGDIIQTGGQFSAQGTSNGNSTTVINVHGDIHVTSGNFSVARGSQNTTGTTTWNLYGDTISIANATTQNSNSAGAIFSFAKQGRQVLSLENINFSGGFPIQVMAGATLSLGESIIRGSGTVRLEEGSTLEVTNAGGLDSALQNTGTKVLFPTASYIFNGSAAQITGSVLPAVVGGITVDNAAGVTLSDTVQVNGTLSVVNGDLDLNGNVITIGESGTLTETAGNIVSGSGKITTTRNIGTPSALNVGGLGAVITADKDLGSTTVERTHAVPSGDGNQGIARVYNIAPGQNNTGLNATLRFGYDESELGAITETSLTLFKSASGEDNTWSPMGGTVNAENNYIEVTGITEFSYWAAGSADAPLPVELTSFAASVSGKKVLLSWVTATEKQNQGWEVERKTEKTSWVKIGFIRGAGDRSEKAEYKYEDASGLSGVVSYRLKQMDYDGSFSYSKTIEVTVNNLPEKYSLHQNYPNPFNPSTVIKYELPEAAFVSIAIYNSIGEQVATLINEQLDAGVYETNFDARNLTSGIYFYRLSAGNNIMIKKMMLIK